MNERGITLEKLSIGYIKYKLFEEKDNPLEKREPWLNNRAREYVKKLINPETEVLEYGGGGSTLYFSDNCKLVHTIETNKEWRKLIQNRLKKNNHKFIEEPEQLYDLILVDSGNDRVKEFREAKKYLREGGVILFDNLDRYDVNDKPFLLIKDYAKQYAGKTIAGVF